MEGLGDRSPQQEGRGGGFYQPARGAAGPRGAAAPEVRAIVFYLLLLPARGGGRAPAAGGAPRAREKWLGKELVLVHIQTPDASETLQDP